MKIRTELHKNLTEWIFRLEFHEEKQSWHYERYNSLRAENTYGWKTILESASQLEIESYIMFVESFNKKRISVEFLLKMKRVWINFYKTLINRSWAILPIEREIK